MQPNIKLLAFDTSAAHCAAALLLDNQIITRVDEMAKGQAEHLMPMLDELLTQAGLSWPDLDAIGVGVGPGNFTGIRISVAAARGLALGLGRPAIGISSLEAQTVGHSGTIVSCLDARRGMAYVQSFAGSALTDAKSVPLNACEMPVLPPKSDPKIVGPLSDEIGALMGWQPVKPLVHIVEGIARLAEQRVHEPQNRPAPLYIRSADAAPPRDPAPVILS